MFSLPQIPGDTMISALCLLLLTVFVVEGFPVNNNEVVALPENNTAAFNATLHIESLLEDLLNLTKDDNLTPLDMRGAAKTGTQVEGRTVIQGLDTIIQLVKSYILGVENVGTDLDVNDEDQTQWSRKEGTGSAGGGGKGRGGCDGGRAGGGSKGCGRGKGNGGGRKRKGDHKLRNHTYFV